MGVDKHAAEVGDLDINPAEYDPEHDPYFWYCRWGSCWDWKEHCDLYLEMEEGLGFVGTGVYWTAFEEREAEWDLQEWQEKFGFPNPT